MSACRRAGPGSDDGTYSVLSDGGTVYGASPPRAPPALSLAARLRAALGVRAGDNSNPAMALYEPSGLSGTSPDSATGSPSVGIYGRAAGPQWVSLDRFVS